MDKNTCWYDTKTITDEMNRNYPVYLNLMPETEHVAAITKQINFLSQIENYRKLSVIDLGCGTAQISLLFPADYFKYEGADLSHILNYCAKKWHPEHEYFPFDVELSNYHWLKAYDVILVNAFIDVMEHPIEVLKKVLSNAKKYVIVHRQEISATKPTQVIKNDSYGGYTYHSIINENDWNTLLKEYNFTCIQHKTCGFGNWENGGGSYLLEKNG